MHHFADDRYGAHHCGVPHGAHGLPEGGELAAVLCGRVLPQQECDRGALPGGDAAAVQPHLLLDDQAVEQCAPVLHLLLHHLPDQPLRQLTRPAPRQPHHRRQVSLGRSAHPLAALRPVLGLLQELGQHPGLDRLDPIHLSAEVRVRGVDLELYEVPRLDDKPSQHRREFQHFHRPPGDPLPSLQAALFALPLDAAHQDKLIWLRGMGQ